VSQSGARSTDGGASVPRLDLIRKAALRHFATHGYDAASMRQIAAEAGITIATLCFHCSTKEQLLFDVLESQMRDLSEGLDHALAAAGDDWAACLATAIRSHIRYVTRDEQGAIISTTELHGLTGESGGIEAGVFASRPRPPPPLDHSSSGRSKAVSAPARRSAFAPGRGSPSST
jgi:AcrR family transcriptional regulator